jgi:hypothetical protein
MPWHACAGERERRRFSSNPFAASAIQRGRWPTPRSDQPFRRKRPSIHRTGGWLVLEGHGKLTPTGVDPRNVHPVASRYTQCAIGVAILYRYSTVCHSWTYVPKSYTDRRLVGSYDYSKTQNTADTKVILHTERDSWAQYVQQLTRRYVHHTTWLLWSKK